MSFFTAEIFGKIRLCLKLGATKHYSNHCAGCEAQI